MIRSMTGYGRSGKEKANKMFTLEMKGVNHRYLDIKFKLPREYYHLEDLFKKVVTQYVSRGRVDVFLRYDVVGSVEKQVNCDLELAKTYFAALVQMKEQFGTEKDVSLEFVARQPDVIQVVDAPENLEEVSDTLTTVLHEACRGFVEMRELEGQQLASDIEEKLSTISTYVGEIETRSPHVVDEYRIRLAERIAELAQDVRIDSDRLAQEVAVFADRSSIDEEIVRLKSHLSQFNSVLRNGGVVGRKLDFVVQEMNREINTIGSKANDYYISQRVVEVKSELEKIREQVQNIE